MKKVVVSQSLYGIGMSKLGKNVEVIVTNNGNSKEILNELKDADAFILRIGEIDKNTIEACENLKVIARTGVGVDNIDVEAATANGIPVVICPASNHIAVSEHVLMMILSISKNIIESDKETRKGNYNIRNKYAAVEIRGKAISILGFGNIGKEVAKLCSAIGMKVTIYDPHKEKGYIEALGYSYTDDIAECVKNADYISLHLPLVPSTRKIIGEAEIKLMKKNAYIINCARGELIDEEALYDALKYKEIAGAAVDLLIEEPMSKENKFMSLDNIIISPHMAAQTQETAEKIGMLVVEGTLAILNGERFENVYNPEVYNHPRWN